MGLLCPECQQGKHGNCNGSGGIDDNNHWLVCDCTLAKHPHRTHFLDRASPNSVVPPNDPGLRAESFPELYDGPWGPSYRLRPDAEILNDLQDVEILNSNGEWVPAVPMGIQRGMGVVQCHCGKYRLGNQRYMEHYAYAHILGMAD